MSMAEDSRRGRAVVTFVNRTCGAVLVCFALGASAGAAAAAAPGRWLARYEVGFRPSETGVPAAHIAVTLQWIGKTSARPASVEVDMADDGFPGGYGAHVRGFEPVVRAADATSATSPAELLSAAAGRYRVPVQSDGLAAYRYSVVLEHAAEGWGPGPDEAPYRFEGGAFWTGRSLFITPPGDARVEVMFAAPQGERVSLSFAPMRGRPGWYEVRDTQRLRDSFLMVGRHRESVLTVNDAVVVLALGGGLADSMPQVEESLRMFLRASEGVFGGAPPARILVAGNLAASGGSLYGGGFADDLSFLAGEPLGADNAARWRPFLCHEVLHLWNGNAIRFEAAQQYWFSEGTTEYYAHTLQARTQLSDEASFLEIVRRKAAAYLGAAGSTSLLAAGDDKFLSQALVYDGGALAALLLDLQIRAATDSRRSLDDVMARLYRTARRRPGRDTTLADIGSALAAAAGRPMDDFLSRHVSGAEPLPLAETLALAGLDLRTEIADRPELMAVLGGLLRCPSVTSTPEGLRVLRSESDAIRPGDLIVGLAGNPVRSFDDVRRAAIHLEPAGRSSVAVLRGGERLDIDVMLGGQPGDPIPRTQHVDVVLERNPGATSAVRAILQSLLAGRDR